MNWPEAIVISTAFICITVVLVWVIKLLIDVNEGDER